MMQKTALIFNNIPKFIEDNERNHDLRSYLKIFHLDEAGADKIFKILNKIDSDELWNKNEIKSNLTALKKRVSATNTIFLDIVLDQLNEQQILKKVLLDLWQKPISKSTNEITGEQILKQFHELMIRYLRINTVIESDFREYTFQRTNKKKQISEYSNFKAIWYNELGEQYVGLSVNYGKTIKNSNDPKEIKNNHENLKYTFLKLFRKMGYSVIERVEKEEGKNEINTSDILLRKGEKLLNMDIKLQYQNLYKNIIINYELWSLYKERYKMLDLNTIKDEI